MTSNIICFSGGIGSGKSTLSLELSKKIGWKATSFGNFLRNLAFERKLDPSRENLQFLGEEMISNGTDNFCNSVLRFCNWVQIENLIIDGIRHSEILESIKRTTKPSNVFLVYIELDLADRSSRLPEQEKNKLAQYETHSTELQVKSNLKKLSDLIIDGNQSVDNSCSLIISFLTNKNILTI